MAKQNQYLDNSLLTMEQSCVVAKTRRQNTSTLSDAIFCSILNLSFCFEILRKERHAAALIDVDDVLTLHKYLSLDVDLRPNAC